MNHYRVTAVMYSGGEKTFCVDAEDEQKAKDSVFSTYRCHVGGMRVALIDRKALLFHNPNTALYENEHKLWKPFTGWLRRVWLCRGCGERLTTELGVIAAPVCPNCNGSFSHEMIEIRTETLP